MKILRVTSLGFEGGGADSGIALMQPVLKERDHEVRILASDKHSELPQFSDYAFSALSSHSKAAKLLYRSFYPHSFVALRAVLKEFKPDIVQLHTMSEVSPSVLFLLKDYPTVLTVHGSEDFTSGLLLWAFPPEFFKKDSFDVESLNMVGYAHYLYHRYLSSRIYKLGFKNVDAFVGFSAFMQNELRKDGIESVHIPNATRLFEPMPPTDESMLLYVGRLEKIKGVQYVLEALPKVVAAHPRVRLVIAGEGSYKDDLQALMYKLGLAHHVKFVGRQNREALGALYAQSSLVVVPSVWPEPFGKVGIEAMSVGRPVIASNVGGISEWLLSGKTGYLVPPGDSSAIAHRVIELLSDKNLREKMSQAAAEQAKNFSIEKHADRILELYEKVIQTHAARKETARTPAQNLW